jgi:hypothetical protein
MAPYAGGLRSASLQLADFHASSGDLLTPHHRRPVDSATETEDGSPGPPSRPWRDHRAVKIDFGIMPWMPLVPSTAWVTW